tara:strand:+ start:29674 stop:30438 length:765 start_codon:yes stop_codon:yes gene_type:complete
MVSFGILLKSAKPGATILRCNGNIPNKAACLIKAKTYKITIFKIDVCQNNPFPEFRSTADYGGATCLNLFDNKKVNLNRNLKIELPSVREEYKGNYKYLSLILKNDFKVSGEYQSNGIFWKTGKESAKDVKKYKNNSGKAFELVESLKNWRGKNNINNKYCDNNGGTSSRCELNYNGNQLTAIGLSSDYVETSGENVKYMFFMIKLSPQINLDSTSEGFFNINYQKDLEVYGNGSLIQSISIAPFIFTANYSGN